MTSHEPHSIPSAADLGVTQGPHGPRLRVWSGAADAMELVLLDGDGTPERSLPMSRTDGDVWEISTPSLHPGRRYAVRCSGPTTPPHAFDPDALLLDPYARGIEPVGAPERPRWTSIVVADEPFDWGGVDHPRHNLEDVVVYEAHVAGFTRRAPHLPPELRGTYAGFAHPETIRYLRETGVNAVELLPVHAFASERHLRRAGLTNYWGYNSLGFFAPHTAYASPAARAAGQEAIAREFKGMVRNLHEAGIEVYLDVVYNHTAEEGLDGETLSLRGLDNNAYYRVDEQGTPIDVTGCGNTVNAAHPTVRQLVTDSLVHWVREYRIDGFRFDLAAALGRDAHVEFDPAHPLLTDVLDDERLAVAKLIAEPWDVGMGGWQTGAFPVGWSEWNDRYRDTARAFWVGDLAHARHAGTPPHGLGAFVTAASGSSDLFGDARGPLASVNFVTAHDGFTMRDLVSYNVKHNLLNGELGRDGTTDNRSYNFGVEGPARDPSIEADRRQTMRNLLGSLLTSAGVPMLAMGDEVGRTQGGNNNPYNQDNETTWFDWEVDEAGLALRAHVARLIELRRAHPALRPRQFNHGDEIVEFATRKIWFDALGSPMADDLWDDPGTRTVQCLASTLVPADGGHEPDELLLIVHGSEDPALVRLPEADRIAEYALLWDSAAERTADVWSAAAPDGHRPGAWLPGETSRMAGPSMRMYRAIVHGTTDAPCTLPR